MKIYKHILGALLLLAPSAFADSQRHIILQLQETLERRITPLVRIVDPEALVFVEVVSKNADVQLPSTPYVLRDFDITNPVGDVEIKSVNVNVLSRMTELPKDLNDLIQSAVRPFGVSAQISKRMLPTAQSKAAPVTAEQVATWMDQAKRNLPSVWFALLGVLGLGLLYMLKRDSGRIGSVLTTGLERVASAMEMGAGGGSTAKAQVDQRPVTAAEAAARSDVFSELPEESLIALLSDCYWGEFDSYAAFVWNNLNTAKRRALVQRWAPMNAYAEFLPQQSAYDLGAASEPYYLSPLPIQTFDNAQLTAAVRATPGLLMKLPRLRRAGLKLTAKERVQMLSAEPLRTAPDFSRLSASAARTLKNAVTIPIATVEEEKEIISMPSLSTVHMEAIPSLNWLLKLPQTEIAKALSAYSARDLASAWIGPEAVLQSLMGYLPERKAQLLKSYVTKLTPRRDSPTFIQLHATAMTYLSQKKEQVNETKKAA